MACKSVVIGIVISLVVLVGVLVTLVILSVEKKKKNGPTPSNNTNMYGQNNQVPVSSQWAQNQYGGHAQYLPAVAAQQRVAQHVAADQSQCAPGFEPAPFYPYGQHAGAAYDASYPNSEDQASRYPRGCGASGASQGYELNIDSLMPASWKGPQNCGADSAAGSQWAKFAPTKEAFDRYITAAGSARLSMNTRSPLARQTGIPLLLRQGPPVPISAQEYPWGDSGFRQDLVFKQTGRYPTSTAC